MGNDCLSPADNKYTSELEMLNVLALKDHWSAIKRFKIKSIYEQFVTPSGQSVLLNGQPVSQPVLQPVSQPVPAAQRAYNGGTLSFNNFCKIFPEFIRYEHQQRKKIYEIFDRDNDGFVNWSDFYESISMCYFCDQSTMAVIMFMIFDEQQQRRFDKQQLAFVIDINAAYIRQELELEPEDIVSELLVDQDTISLDRWVEEAPNYMQFSQFRQLFHIFEEEKLEKELVRNFEEWNQLYDPIQQKYVSYVVSFKWFEVWKTYVEMEYGIVFGDSHNNPSTSLSIATRRSFKKDNSCESLKINNSCKSVKTNKSCKSLKTNKSCKSLRMIDSSALKRFRFTRPLKQTQQDHKKGVDYVLGASNDSRELHSCKIRDYDIIKGYIGERPKEIYNHLLEFEHPEILRPGLIQNRDYVLVSEKVWEYLAEVYSGSPELRRTGFNHIELYPKVLKIYSGLFQDEIAYCTEVVRQVSNHMSIQQMFTKTLEVDPRECSVFYRTFAMKSWECVSNPAQAFADLTSEIIIMMVYLRSSKDIKTFKERYLRPADKIESTNLGDSLIYLDPDSKLRVDAIFLNKTLQGKFIIHFMGQHYENNLCLTAKQFQQLCQLKTSSVSDNSNEYLPPSYKQLDAMGFIASTVLQFDRKKNLKKVIRKVGTQNSSRDKPSLCMILAEISNQLKYSPRVQSNYLQAMVNDYFPDFQTFDISKCAMFLHAFLGAIKKELCSNQEIKSRREKQETKIIQQEYEFTLIEHLQCTKCGTRIEQVESEHSLLSIPVPEREHAYYHVIYVPFTRTCESKPLRRYGFRLSRTANFAQYKYKFQQVANLNDIPYILVQVQDCDIIRNFSHINTDISLQSLKLRQNDAIYAFEMHLSFDGFIKEHYLLQEKENVEVEGNKIKVGHMVDCYCAGRGWIVGKVLQKDIRPYTYKQNLLVLHKPNKKQSVQMNYEIERCSIAYFPSRSYLNADHYHIKLLQRVFVEAYNNMKRCSLPMVIVLASWIRLKQLKYLVYLQLRRFIADEKAFSQSNHEYLKSSEASTFQNAITQQSKKKHAKKFKEYLYGKNLPYKLSFVDDSGRCAVCYRLVKYVVHKGESQKHCDGCSLPSEQQPVCWQIQVTDLTICVEWKHNKFRKDLQGSKIIRNHTSYTQTSASKRSDLRTVQKCVDDYLNKPAEERLWMDCCSEDLEAQVRREIVKVPNTLIINLVHINEQDGFNDCFQEHVHSGSEELAINGSGYRLVGVTNFHGGKNTPSYSTDLKDSEKDWWVRYQGGKVSLAGRQDRQTLVYYYERVSSQRKNSLQYGTKGLLSEERDNSHEFMNVYSRADSLIDRMKDVPEFNYKLEQSESEQSELGDYKSPKG